MNRVGRSEENQGTAGLQTKLDETGHSRTLQCRYQLAEKAERSDDSAANWAVNWNWERGILTGCRTGPYPEGQQSSRNKEDQVPLPLSGNLVEQNNEKAQVI